MKKSFFSLVVTALMLCACEKDHITTVTPINNDTTDIEDDNDTTYSRVVTIVFGSSQATVSGTGNEQNVSISGNGVTIVNSSTEKVLYELSGNTSNGYLKIYSEKKQHLLFNGVSITNPNGAAINIQGPTSSPSSGKKTKVILRGQNSLADGTTYSNTPSDEDEKGVFFNEGKLNFTGNGSLTVTASGKNGIVSDDYVKISDTATISVTSSAGHGVRGKNSVIINGGILNITTSANMKKGISTDNICRITGGQTTITVTGGTAIDDNGDTTSTAGIKCNGNFYISGGTLTISNSGKGGKGINGDGSAWFNGGEVSVTTTGTNYGTSGGGGWPGGGHNQSSGGVKAKGIRFEGPIEFNDGTVTVNCGSDEGIESKSTITINGGVVYSHASDDAINSASHMVINNGIVCGHSSGGDGLDANGDLIINGGLVYAIGTNSPEVGLDAEESHKLYINGGTIIGIGGFERAFGGTQAGYKASSWTANTWYSLTDGNNTYAFKTPQSGSTTLAISGGDINTTTSLKKGVSVSGGTDYFNVTFNVGGTYSGGTSVSLSNYTGESGGGGWH